MVLQWLRRGVIRPVAHAFEETWLITHLTVNLIGEMGSRIMWLWMTVRFAVYVLLLAPAFLRAAFIYAISDFIKKSIVYGKNRRNTLDLYLPSIHTYPDVRETIRRESVKGHRKIRNSLESIENIETSLEQKWPVVVFFSGGAWMIGYKAWGAFMGMLLAQLGVLFVAPDHRNFPQGNITHMMEDCSNAIQWTFGNIGKYGGDKNKIFIVSQSAGAHISFLVLLKHAYYHAKRKYLNAKVSNNKDNNIQSTDTKIKNGLHPKNEENNNKEIDIITNKWDPSQLKAYIGIAGPYNLVELTDYWNEKGLYTNVLLHIMNGNFEKYSPMHQLSNVFKRKRFNTTTTRTQNDEAVELNTSSANNNNVNRNDCGSSFDSCSNDSIESSDKCHQRNTANNDSSELEPKYDLEMCPVYLFHGGCDETVPCQGTNEFAKELLQFDVKTKLKIYADKSHTGPIVEDPIEGNDILVCDILKIIYPNHSLDKIVEEIEATMRGNLKMPKKLVDAARIVCPF